MEKQSDWNVFKYKKELKNKKLESYINYILSDGILKSFPDCVDYNVYSYEIRVVTNFVPDADYLGAIDNMNKYIAKLISNMNIRITQEKLKIKKKVRFR